MLFILGVAESASVESLGDSGSHTLATANQPQTTYDWGDAPDSYGTDAIDNGGEGVGPSHEVDPLLGLGILTDSETDGQPAINADGDDNNGDDDEDGYSPYDPGSYPTAVCVQKNKFEVTYHNDTGNDAYIYAWFDFNSDGIFHPVDDLIINAEIAEDDDNVGTTFKPKFDIPCDATPAQITYIRVRISTASTGILPTGPDGIGEVEDYTKELFGWDFGDSNNLFPDGNGETSWEPALDHIYKAGAAHHMLTDELRLGTCVDAETNGQPTTTSLPIETTGDDDNATTLSPYSPACEDGDDEDGLVNLIGVDLIKSTAGITATAKLSVVVNGITEPACIWGWIDWGNDTYNNGSYGFSGGTQINLTAADNGIPFEISLTELLSPDDLQFGTAIPIRLSIMPATSLLGSIQCHENMHKASAVAMVYGGEVEDHSISFNPVSIGSFVWEDSNRNGLQDNGETGLENATVTLLEDDGSGIFVAATDISSVAVVSQTTSAEGNYHFTNLFPGNYRVQVTPPAGFDPSTIQTTADNDNSETDSNIASQPIAGTYESGTFTLAIGAELAETGSADGDDQDDAQETNGNMTVDFGFMPEPIFDWGDLPDASSSLSTSFPTTNVDNGPRHQITNDLYLGNCVDAETDGAPDPEAGMDGAGGDDSTVASICTNDDDEDGVTLITPMIAGEQACVSVTSTNSTGATAKLQGWIDFNGNGAIDSGEELTTDDFASGGADIADGGVTAQSTCFTVPADATFDGGETYLRWRLSSEGSLTEVGIANDGEVEDYHQPLACLGNYVWHDAINDGIQGPTENGINGVVVNAMWAGLDGDINTADDNVTYSTTTTTMDSAEGHYYFCGLLPGETFQVSIPTAPMLYPESAITGTGTATTDSDGVQTVAGASVMGPTVTIPTVDYNTAPMLDWSSGESSIGDSAGLENYPDASTNVSIDFGFIAKATAVGLTNQAANTSQPLIWAAVWVMLSTATIWVVLKRTSIGD